MGDYSLSASTFFYLLLYIRNGGIKRGKPSQTACFRAFIDIVDSQAVSAFKESADLELLKPHASRLRNAKPDGKTNVYMNFGNALMADAFENQLQNDPNVVFDKIDNYFNKYTNNTDYMKEWIVKQLLGLIEADGSIGEKEFVINSQRTKFHKNEVLSQDNIDFYYFMSGIWLYIYRYGKDIEVGRNTIKSWDIINEQSDLLGIGNKFDNIKIDFDRTITDSKNIEKIEKNNQGLSFSDSDIQIRGIHYINAEDIIRYRDNQYDNEAPYTKYLREIRKKHYMVNTFLYENARKLDSFYVCNDLFLKEGQKVVFAKDNDCTIIENATIDKFPFDTHRGILISAEGGMGKSMMLHHLVVDMVDKFSKLKEVPIFVTARLYNPEKENVTELIFKEFQRHNSEFGMPDIMSLFESGCAVVLVDGLDEINSNYINTFMDEFDRFEDCYSKVKFVFSTRKHINSPSLSGFCKYNLQPFDINQAVQMVKKLDDNVINAYTRESFIEALQNGTNGLNWEEQHEFLGNPLLLTIMLLAYEDNFEIPTQRYLFYENAYIALARKHDVSKGLIREFKTGLSVKNFQLLFGEFCAVTYEKEKYEFDDDELYETISEVIKFNEVSISVEDFIADVTERLCLMYKDGGKYYFIHRSFQEYFTAYFFSKKDAIYYKPIYEMFVYYDECRHEDQVLNMLYGMAPESVELHIIIPFLEKLLEGECGDYFSFLQKIYPTLYFEEGECAEHYPSHDSESAIYNFTKIHYGIEQCCILKAIPDMPDIIPFKVFYRFSDIANDGEDYLNRYIVAEKNDLLCNNFKVANIVGDKAGCIYEVPVSEMSLEPIKYHKLLDYVSDEKFCLKQEYNLAVELLQKIKDKYKKKPGHSFISKFH